MRHRNDGIVWMQETNDFGCGTHIEILLKVPLPIGRFFVRESSTTTTTTTTTRKELAFWPIRRARQIQESIQDGITGEKWMSSNSNSGGGFETLGIAAHTACAGINVCTRRWSKRALVGRYSLHSTTNGIDKRESSYFFSQSLTEYLFICIWLPKERNRSETTLWFKKLRERWLICRLSESSARYCH